MDYQFTEFDPTTLREERFEQLRKLFNQLLMRSGGDVEEENATCYLQVLLCEYLPAVGRRRVLRDMDVWGYTFREGSAAAWFEGDGCSARAWLFERKLIDEAGRPTWRLRVSS